ncbi:transcript variant X2 [Nothobranchius furzeri]|uniref:Transcript variant X2 n=1 Tax=Nothobranchius furzeri TaxID=105023 RepID=A0A8C6KTM8_NOTFU|nr:transcript variant X2 [Nothobranchius furzeri]
MAVEISKDLVVQVLEDVNVIKLTTRQQVLCAAIRRGETKCLGVTQVMLGLMVMSYSIPLHITEATDVVTFGVPWWTGLTPQECVLLGRGPHSPLEPLHPQGRTKEGPAVLLLVVIWTCILESCLQVPCNTKFIAAGVIIAILETHCTMKTMQFCFMMSVLSVVLSLVAMIIYSVDLNNDMSCGMERNTSCGTNKYTRLSRCLKASLLIFTLAQTVVSAVVCFLLVRLRHYFQQYSSISQAAEPITP